MFLRGKLYEVLLILSDVDFVLFISLGLDQGVLQCLISFKQGEVQYEKETKLTYIYYYAL